MDKQDVKKLIMSSQEEEFFFTGGITEELVQEIEKELNVKLSESYKWFLSHYGYGGIDGVLIQDVELDELLEVVDTTRSLREYGLLRNLVVIENMDEYVYGLDAAQMNNNECPIVNWDQSTGIGKKQYNNLYSYLYDRFNDAVENL
ncbi:SMI1/KNR4 family protein [Metabacillus fastidiosus]|uniref:SMI1/KNR4 family protein n=1 Tax=Metabacillus fastidiosus TaxID=1458 RepID=UPI003D285354